MKRRIKKILVFGTLIASTLATYGVDISTYEELISAHKTVDEVCKIIGADSLSFISKEALFEAGKRNDLCLACFTGNYPTALYQSIKDANKDGKF